jgi:hypothetical protein
LAIDAAAIIATVASGPWLLTHWIFVPLVVSVTHQLVELLGRQAVDSQRELCRQRQQVLLTDKVSAPLVEWLAQWPATGGSSFERLQLALRRIPEAISQVNARVQQTVNRERELASQER